jgi:PAS domain S-box-containing protein
MPTSILVVEDENIVAKDIVNRLRNLGYAVCGTAATGEDAIAATNIQHPDLVLMDIMLKGGMDGVDAASVITDRYDIPVIYLTAYADEKTLQRAKQTEAFGYLLKPFEERELHITIEMALFKHQMERRLRESEEWLAALLQSIGDAVIATDTGGVIRLMNAVAERLTGWPQAEAVGKPLAEVYRTVDAKTGELLPPPIEQALRRDIPRRLVMRTLLRSRGGRDIFIDDTASPIRNASGEATGIVVVFRDVTEQRHAEEALRQSQSQLAGIVGSAMDGIVTADTNRIVLLYNAAAEKIFGYSAQEILGQPLEKLFPVRSRDVHVQAIDEFSASNIRRRMLGSATPVQGLRKSGEEFPIEASISQIEVSGKKLLTIILRDITDRNRLEEQLRQTQKMESIGTLASGIAHDFNNVLNNVLGFAQQLRKYVRDEVKVLKYVDTIERSAQRGAELATQLLSFARTSRHKESSTSLPGIINEVVVSCRDTFEPGVRIETAIDPSLTSILGEHRELYQVILNLCVNARDAIIAKAGDGTGVISISAKNVTIGKDIAAPFTPFPGNFCVEISVSDTGTGIPDTIKNKIFDPFFTTKERGRGTGLGLSIVYNIVRAHRGTLMVESELGKGTVFRMLFPAEHQNIVPDRATDKNAPLILLVDDEPAMQELGKELLEDEGYEVLIASSGNQAIDIYQGHPGEIDLVILDLVMPGMDGTQVYLNLKALNPDIKAFFCTGFVSDDLISTLLQEEQLKAIAKPFRPDQFLQTVREVLGQ